MCSLHFMSRVLKIPYEICPFSTFFYNPVLEYRDIESYIDTSLTAEQFTPVVTT